MKLAPAILVKNQEQYSAELAIVEKIADRYQFDFIDGEFVNNQSLDLDKIKSNDLILDIDLMAAKPSSFIERTIAKKPALIVLHIECNEQIKPNIELIKQAGVKVGVAFNPETNINLIMELLDAVDHVLVMGYEAGFAGQRFQPKALDNVRKIKLANSGIEVGVDGGVNTDNIVQIKSSGADIAYVNTAIFKTPDPAQAYKKLSELVL